MGLRPDRSGEVSLEEDSPIYAEKVENLSPMTLRTRHEAEVADALGEFYDPRGLIKPVSPMADRNDIAPACCKPFDGKIPEGICGRGFRTTIRIGNVDQSTGDRFSILVNHSS